jgi:hypothetical protein
VVNVGLKLYYYKMIKIVLKTGDYFIEDKTIDLIYVHACIKHSVVKLHSR